MKKPRLVMRAEAAKALGMAPARISQWVSDGAPVARRGHRGRPALYDVAQLRQWVAARALATEPNLSLEVERAGLARAQRLKIERENKRASGELWPRDLIVKEGRAFVIAWRAKVLNWPHRAMQLGIIHTPAQFEALKQLSHELLTECSQWKTSADTEAAASEGAQTL